MTDADRPSSNGAATPRPTDRWRPDWSALTAEFTGTAFLLAAVIGVLVDEGLTADRWLAENATGDSENTPGSNVYWTGASVATSMPASSGNHTSTVIGFSRWSASTVIVCTPTP